MWWESIPLHFSGLEVHSKKWNLWWRNVSLMDGFKSKPRVLKMLFLCGHTLLFFTEKIPNFFYKVFPNLSVVFLSPVIQSWNVESLPDCGLGPVPSSPDPTLCDWTPGGPVLWSLWAGHRKRQQPANSSNSTPTESGTQMIPASPWGKKQRWTNSSRLHIQQFSKGY